MACIAQKAVYFRREKTGMKGLSKEVREIMKEYIGDNSVAGVTVLAVQDGKEICDCRKAWRISKMDV